MIYGYARVPTSDQKTDLQILALQEAGWCGGHENHQDLAATRLTFDLPPLDSGLEVAFSLKLAQGLEQAHPDDLSDAEISPSGLGIHFPRLDADIYLPSLLEGLLGSKSWMAAERGKRGGSASTEAKAAASRKNGKLGGRPKKLKELMA